MSAAVYLLEDMSQQPHVPPTARGPWSRLTRAEPHALSPQRQHHHVWHSSYPSWLSSCVSAHDHLLEILPPQGAPFPAPAMADQQVVVARPLRGGLPPRVATYRAFKWLLRNKESERFPAPI